MWVIVRKILIDWRLKVLQQVRRQVRRQTEDARHSTLLSRILQQLCVKILKFFDLNIEVSQFTGVIILRRSTKQQNLVEIKLKASMHQKIALLFSSSTVASAQ